MILFMAQEKQYENKIKKYLKERGAWLIKYWGGASFTKSGVPDILACVNGYFVGIEVKAENGRPSNLQIYNIKKIREADGIAFVLYPNDWDMFQNIITMLLRDDYGRAYNYQKEFDKKDF